MDNIKITVNFTLSGRVRNRINNDPETKIYKYKDCNQTINMSRDAYVELLRTPCNNITPKHWQRLNPYQRISEHLKELQHDLQATNFTFVIYND